MTTIYVYIDAEHGSEADIKDGARAFFRAKNQRPIGMFYAVDDGEVMVWRPGDPLPDLDWANVVYVCHNANFEKQVCKVYKWPEPKRWIDTAALAAMRALPRKLEKVAEVLGLDMQKDMQGHKLMMRVTRPRKPTKHDKSIWYGGPEEIDRVLEYGKQDVRVCREIHRVLGDFEADERQVWELDQKINERGVQVDVQFVRSMVELWNEHVGNINTELKAISGISTTNCVKQIRDWTAKHGCELPKLNKETVLEAMARPELPRDVRRVLELRLKASKSSVNKYAAILRSVCPDNRVRDLFLYGGASTGRWAGRVLQPQNLPRQGLKNYRDWMEIINRKDLAAFEVIGMDVGDVGMKLVRPTAMAP
ncbi:MAG: hypothetical protein ACE361_00915 [Aureliella sp.]